MMYVKCLLDFLITAKLNLKKILIIVKYSSGEKPEKNRFNML